METANSQVIMEKAKSFANYLNQNSMNVNVDNTSLREYSVKLKSTEFGRGSIVLYYSSNKNAFNIRNENLTKNIYESVSKHWDIFNLGSVKLESSGPTFIAEEYSLYTDGSYDAFENTAYAFIVLKGNKIIHEQASRFEADSDEERNSYQVISEIKAVECGLEWCANNGIKELALYYDYENLEKWVSGEYKAKKYFTCAYVSFVRNCGIKISWHKVKAHSGDMMNEKADKLATSALSDDNSREEIIKDFYLSCEKFEEKFRCLGYTDAYLKKNPSSTPSCTLVLGKKDKIHFYLRNDREISESLHEISLTEKDKIKGILKDYLDKKAFSQSEPCTDVKYIKLKHLYTILKRYKNCNFDFSVLAEEISSFFPAEKNILMSNIYSFSELETYVKRLTGNLQQ